MQMQFTEINIYIVVCLISDLEIKVASALI